MLLHLLQAFLTVTLLVVAGLVLLYMATDVPPVNGAAAAQRNTYLYADGTLIGTDGSVNRQDVTLAQVPPMVRHAVLAAEDRRFYEEGALDLRAMLRGAYRTLEGEGKQSGSTITQQYVKNLYLNQKQTTSRKIREIFIAIKVDRRLSKDEILEAYLNICYFGRNSYGIRAAAQAYFGKDVPKLTLAEGAYLATLLEAPSSYDIGAYPKHRKTVERRWHHVLTGMVDQGWLTRSVKKGLRFPQLKAAHPHAGLSGQRGYVVQAVKQQLLNNNVVSERDISAGGFTVTTTIDPGRQAELTEAVARQLLSHLSPKRRQDAWVRAAAVSLDPHTGRTVALYGGRDASREYVNGATRRDYQVGSLFKPFVLTAALDNSSRTQNGEPITPDTIYDGTSQRPVQGGPGGSVYAPGNEDGRSFGNITVRTAMEQSVNTVFAQMAVDVDCRAVRSTAVALGVPGQTIPPDPGASIGLGTVQASVLDMAQAYATLDNHGAHGLYTLVDKVTKDGTVIALPPQMSVQVVTRAAADTTTRVLHDVVAHGTAQAAQELNRTAAAKTGTAEADRAAWFAGYTPELVTVVAIQGQDPTTGALRSLYGVADRDRVNGSDFPAMIWTDYMKAALSRTPRSPFDLAPPALGF
ncbi:transglycosylase domain-containing protein [Streptomyces sp. NPDC057910]|uniref:transglycosylase domain-containing protein n=1 Tax=Streptomyces sp. NPDC057910 TaxID=3346278 RepID=UPI0036E7DD50